MPWNGSTWVPYEELANGTLVEIGAYNNDVSGGIFGISVLIAIFMIFFVSGLKFRSELEVSMASAMFVTTISSYFMTIMGWVMVEAAYAMTFLLVGSIAMLYRGGK